MGFDVNNLEDSLFQLFDQVKVFMTDELWDNVLVNCTKNEMMVLMLLYRRSDVNMSQVADYLVIPLNTATGIISRMEKKKMVSRVRSSADKRVVTLALTNEGKEQMNAILGMYLVYGQKIVEALEPEEIDLLTKVIEKVIDVLKEDVGAVTKKEPVKVRKIVIE